MAIKFKKIPAHLVVDFPLSASFTDIWYMVKTSLGIFFNNSFEGENNKKNITSIKKEYALNLGREKNLGKYKGSTNLDIVFLEGKFIYNKRKDSQHKIVDKIKEMMQTENIINLGITYDKKGIVEVRTIYNVIYDEKDIQNNKDYFPCWVFIEQNNKEGVPE